MLLKSFISAVALIAQVSASPLISSHIVHESRDTLPQGWLRKKPLDSGHVLPMRIALTQANLDKGEEWLNEISHPNSPRYGQHWTAKQVAEAFAPSKETVDAVRAWIATIGISDKRVRHSRSLGFLEFDATVNEAQQLLRTQYHIYEHETGQPHIACEEYSIPAHLQDHVDFVYPTLHFDVQFNKELSGTAPPVVEKRAFHPNGVGNGLGQPGSGSLPKLGQVLPKPSDVISGLAGCDTQIIPDCLRALYKFPVNNKMAANNSFGILELTPQAYVPGDLDMFFANFSTSQVGNRPILDSIDGGVVQQNNMSFGYNGESDLDFEYAMTLVYPQNVTLYQAGDDVIGASLNTFLDALDASYCTFRGGDDPKVDPTYPDTYPNGYDGPENCGGFSATNVISSSYNYNEHDLTEFYERRQCYEYMKLGMMGVTVLFSSGDYGVESNIGLCINGTGHKAPYIAGSDGGRFAPTFPGTCPYVTTVGATQVKPNTSVPAALASATEPEQACETKIYSGGGFSDVFKLPSYQADAVHNWFTTYPPPYSASQFNNSQNTRGLPDVSANGANYAVIYDGHLGLAYGTSASAPTFGSIITLINQARLLQGKSTVGFINPVAYAHPEIFNDITEGSNPGCATNGFSASPGWDPVTGLGTPNYPKMLKLWKSLS